MEYEINGRIIKFTPHKFEGKLSLEEYENQIYSSLSKIGIEKPFIEITISKIDEEPFAKVNWIINKRNFEFRCDTQENPTLNLGAIAQAIQDDIRQITRGIKNLNQIMNQYDKTPLKKKTNSGLMKFSNEEKLKNNSQNDLFPIEDLIMETPINEKLDSKYHYLLKYSPEQLDKMYFRLKEQCILQNKPNHEMLKALKIVRTKKGLSL